MGVDVLKIINIEGIDGSGKTGLLEDLKEEFKEDKYCFISFPTSYFYRSYEALKKMGYNEKEFAKEVNRLQTNDKKKAYEYWKGKGKEIMFCDRFDVSQKVYNGSSLKVDTVETPIVSDTVVYIDIEVDTVLKRIEDRNTEDCLGYEEENTLREIKKRYDSVIEDEYKGRVLVFPVTEGTTKEELTSAVIEELREHI